MAFKTGCVLMYPLLIYLIFWKSWYYNFWDSSREHPHNLYQILPQPARKVDKIIRLYSHLLSKTSSYYRIGELWSQRKWLLFFQIIYAHKSNKQINLNYANVITFIFPLNVIKIFKIETKAIMRNFILNWW